LHYSGSYHQTKFTFIKIGTISAYGKRSTPKSFLRKLSKIIDNALYIMTLWTVYPIKFSVHTKEIMVLKLELCKCY